jgi:hypothetical protein
LHKLPRAEVRTTDPHYPSKEIIHSGTALTEVLHTHSQVQGVISQYSLADTAGLLRVLKLIQEQSQSPFSDADGNYELGELLPRVQNVSPKVNRELAH